MSDVIINLFDVADYLEFIHGHKVIVIELKDIKRNVMLVKYKLSSEDYQFHIQSTGLKVDNYMEMSIGIEEVKEWAIINRRDKNITEVFSTD